jgi:hypothetical protein
VLRRADASSAISPFALLQTLTTPLASLDYQAESGQLRSSLADNFVAMVDLSAAALPHVRRLRLQHPGASLKKLLSMLQEVKALKKLDLKTLRDIIKQEDLSPCRCVSDQS